MTVEVVTGKSNESHRDELDVYEDIMRLRNMGKERRECYIRSANSCLNRNYRAALMTEMKQNYKSSPISELRDGVCLSFQLFAPDTGVMPSLDYSTMEGGSLQFILNIIIADLRQTNADLRQTNADLKAETIKKTNVIIQLKKQSQTKDKKIAELEEAIEIHNQSFSEALQFQDKKQNELEESVDEATMYLTKLLSVLKLVKNRK